MEMSDIQIEFKVSPDAEYAQLTPSVEIQLMRIIQEALTNVRKHSRATTVGIMFERDNNELCVTITDNGQGFDLARVPSVGRPRFGLHTMRERAEAVGGVLSIDTTPGQGTKVEIRMACIVTREN